MKHEIHKSGLPVEQQFPINVWYDGVVVGEYIADLIVENCVIIELKVVKSLDDIHAAQCLNYLRATHHPIALLINFGKPRIEVKRFRL